MTTWKLTPRLLLPAAACGLLPPASRECRPSPGSPGGRLCKPARRRPCDRRGAPCTAGTPGSQAALDRRHSSFFLSSQATKKPIAESGIEPRGHRQHPPLGLRGVAQFYRVLLGHQDRQAVAELEVLRRERMVVAERMRQDLD